MTKIRIIFGTESGGSELAAEDIAESLIPEHDVTVTNMSEVDVEGFESDALYLVVCSSHGEGELPASAKPLHASLLAKRPDLMGVRYGIYGRGDVSYLKTFLHGPQAIDATLRGLGAERIGTFGEHDSSDWDAAEDAPMSWAASVVEVYEDARVAR